MALTARLKSTYHSPLGSSVVVAAVEKVELRKLSLYFTIFRILENEYDTI